MPECHCGQCICWRPGVTSSSFHSLQSATSSNGVFTIDVAFGTNTMEWRSQTTTPAHGLPMITTTAASLSSSLLCGLNVIPVNLVEYSIDSGNSSSSSHGDVYEDVCCVPMQDSSRMTHIGMQRRRIILILLMKRSKAITTMLPMKAVGHHHFWKIVTMSVEPSEPLVKSHAYASSSSLLQLSTATTTDDAQLPLRLIDEIQVIGGKYKGQLETFECRTTRNASKSIYPR